MSNPVISGKKKLSQKHSYEASFLKDDCLIKDKEKGVCYPTAPTGLIQTPNFCGREDKVSEIVEIVKSGNSCYLHGMGGIGKTEIVKSVVMRLSDICCDSEEVVVIGPGEVKYPLEKIIWINYMNGDEVGFKTNVVSAVHPKTNVYNLDEQYKQSVESLRSMKARLLLVIDNIEHVDQVLKDFYNGLNIKEAGVPVRVIFSGRPLPYFNKNELKPVEATPLLEGDCKKLFKVYCDFDQNEESDVDKIIDLVDKHTVTIELIAKLIKKQEKGIGDFLQVLNANGFNNIRFVDEEEELVDSNHDLMRKERKIIEQLKILFNTINLTDEEKRLLIKISIIPNLPFNFNMAKKWFSINNRNEIASLSANGWVKQIECSKNKKEYYMHSIIATAVRAQFSDLLYEVCQPFIKEVTNEMIAMSNKNIKKIKILTQFSWAITEVFQEKFNSIDDYCFLEQLAEIYNTIGDVFKQTKIRDLSIKLVGIK